MPYSGPASAYGVIGKTEAAYFRKINAEGGINGRKITFISYDDAYSPPKAVERARRLVESDEVLLIFNPLGTPSNTALQKYLNGKNVPQLFVASGADPQWDDDPGMKKFAAFLRDYAPDSNKLDGATFHGYGVAQTLVEVLTKCGDNLTRDNVMRQAQNLKDVAPDTLLPGIRINTSPADFAPIKQLQMCGSRDGHGNDSATSCPATSVTRMAAEIQSPGARMSASRSDRVFCWSAPWLMPTPAVNRYRT
jgi:hypothetical protein